MRNLSFNIGAIMIYWTYRRGSEDQALAFGGLN